MTTDPALADRLRAVLAETIAPALDLDPAGIEVLDVTDGVARVRFGAACASCPASLMVLVQGIEDEVRKLLPEVDYIEPAV